MIDEIAFFVFSGCGLAYRLLVWYQTRHPGIYKRNVLNQLYYKWVDARIKEDITVAVQALRNLIMACSIFITALLVFIGLLVEVFQVQLVDTTPFLGIAPLTVGMVKVGLNTFLIFACLTCFIMSIRRAVRVTLIISSDPASIREGSIDGLTLTRNAFMSSQNYWMFGVRLVFYSVSAISWLVSPVFLLIGTVIITVYLVLFEDVWSVK